MFLLGGTYRSDPDGVVIELFGKTPEGSSLVARYYGFRPYFQLTDPTPEDRERLSRDPEVVRTEPRTLWLNGAERTVLQVTIQSPRKVPEYRERYQRSGGLPSVLACDIPFVHRFLYDKGLGLTLTFDAEEEPAEIRDLYTVPRVVRIVETPDRPIRAGEPFRPPLRILSFDIENAIRERTIFTICGVVEGGPGGRKSFQIYGPDERKVLEEFAAKIREEDPDVITGYNIGGYDIPLLLERVRATGTPEFGVGRDKSAPRDAGERLFRITGRVVADAWWSVRRDLKPKQETLQFVARTLLGDSKLDVDRRNISQEWARDPKRVMEYCEHDADLAYRILQRLRTVERATDLATVAHLPLEEGLNGRTSQFIDALLIPRADREGVGVPPNHMGRRENPIEGGYVHSIRPGIYRWVVVLDFKSMYPSIIISKNLCFTTLSPQGTTVAPGGTARFLSREVRRGLIPAILEELLAQRDRFRQQARSADSPEMREYFDGLQSAVKVLMNSFYGVLASSFYRFTDKEIGAAITAFAREAITHIIHSLETDGYEVVYSDTDSVFVRSPETTLEGARRFGEQLSQRFTQAGVTFEFQSVYSVFFSHGAKKRYVAKQLWPREETIVRGYETRRTDAFEYQSSALQEIFDRVLAEDIDGLLRRSRELVAAVRNRQVPASQLVIARSVRPEDQYNEATREALPFLRVFRQLKQEGYDVIPGMKVAWIVTDSRQSPQAIEPWIEGRPMTREPDWDYYADRVAQTLARVTEVFQWDAAALLRGNHQRRIDDAPAPSESGAATTLDTPLDQVERPAKRRTRSLKDWS
jgi:DNA polymerase I